MMLLKTNMFTSRLIINFLNKNESVCSGHCTIAEFHVPWNY